MTDDTHHAPARPALARPTLAAARILRTDNRIVFQAMGSLVSLSSPEWLPDEVGREVQEILEGYDELLNPLREGSEAQRVATGALAVRRASSRFQYVHDLAQTWMMDTDGAFTPNRPDGHVDLSGIATGLAMRECGDALAGLPRWRLDVGDNVMVSTFPGAENRSPVALPDPDDPSRFGGHIILDPCHPAVATCWDDPDEPAIWHLDPDSPFCQVSVAGPDILACDVLATAIMSGGERTLERVCHTWPIEVLAFTRDNAVHATRGFVA